MYLPLIDMDKRFSGRENILWNDYIRPDFRIIVVNNGGGGIFRILPGRKSDESFERFFETTHQWSFDKICENFGLEYYKADDSGSLKNSLNKFFNPGQRARLLEIRTPRSLNDRVLLGYFEFLSSKLYN